MSDFLSYSLPILCIKEKMEMILYPPYRPSHPSFSSFSPRLTSMNPSMSSHYGSSLLSPAPDSASSASLQSPFPFILSIQAPNNAPFSYSTRGPGSRCPSPPANCPVVDYKSHTSPFPCSQHPPSPYGDSLDTDPKEKRPPRPSNAFILFRSDFLKRKFISTGQEARQHKLSIIVAKCWHKLTREEKQKWFLEAEREKKAHALKYADYQSQSQSRGARARTRTRTRRESRIIASPPRELDHLGRLADIAYQEILNDIPSKLKRESTTSPSLSTTTTLESGSPTPSPCVQWNNLFTLDCYQEQEQPFSFPAGEEGQLFLTTSSTSDFSTFQDARMFPTVSLFNTSFTSPGTVPHHVFFLFARLVLLARRILQ